MIQVYADGWRVYDSRLDDYALLGLRATTGVNKGGTADIIMPPGHPGYSKFPAYKTIVEIHRDNKLAFRGRALYHADDFANNRTVTCEGEYCFFQDAVIRPYLYTGTPDQIFGQVLQEYNSQVDGFKQFRLGEITVQDANDYIRVESESPEQAIAVFDKLLERCGGYITFTTAEDGVREVNWLASIGTRSDQAIEFGGNLLDFSRNGANANLVTAVLPYGAKDEETGVRVDIKSVNDGVDYIVDEDAVAVRGFIIKPVMWDDVTTPTALLRKAQEYLEQNRYIVNSLSLSAVDLSYLDKTIDSFAVGDKIRVKSTPHQVDEDFMLTEKTEDFLDPAGCSITLGKDIKTLTGADVAGDDYSRSELHKVTQSIRKDYELNTLRAIEATEAAMASLIEQAGDRILLQVSEEYTTNGALEAAVSSSMTQLADQFLFEFTELKTEVDGHASDDDARFKEIYNYISFEGGTITLGEGDNPLTLTIEHDRIVFRNNGAQVGWWDGVDFHTGNIVVEVEERAQFGNFAFVPRSNGSLSFLKVGG